MTTSDGSVSKKLDGTWLEPLGSSALGTDGVMTVCTPRLCSGPKEALHAER